MGRAEKTAESAGKGDIALPVMIGAVYANFAEAVEIRGGDGAVLREKSIAALEEALSRRSDLWPLWEREGEQLEKLGKFEAAAEAYRKSLSRAKWNSTLKRKLFRAMVAATVARANGIDADSVSRPAGTRTTIREKATRRLPRRPRSERIRRYYRIGRLPFRA